MTDYAPDQRPPPAHIEVTPAERRVRVTRGDVVVTLAYTGRADRWMWITPKLEARVNARIAARVLDDLVPDARALLRAAVAGLTPAAQATALEGL